MPHLMYNREKERRMRYAFQKKDRKILQLLHAWDKTGRGTGALRQTRCGKCLFQVQKVHLRSLQAHPVKAKGFGFYEIRSRRLQPVKNAGKQIAFRRIIYWIIFRKSSSDKMGIPSSFAFRSLEPAFSPTTT